VHMTLAAINEHICVQTVSLQTPEKE
jgi:hypothetical protein